MLVLDLLGNVGAYPLEWISDKTSNGWETKSDALQLEHAGGGGARATKASSKLGL
ncbi:unnamed protein product [marine sediment metagenome]|uniref:Uncharacterized protein n=1 Tax=marine sediment metagenome TaxID=412755 RepID=X0Z780_9ZZZZ